MNASNSLLHSILTKDTEGNTLKIDIRLSDECKNGHQDFSITATGWKKGKPHTDRNFLFGGCCHDKILAARPDLSIFVRLHLCDFSGVPIHAAANGFYHLKHGFSTTKPGSPDFPREFSNYYRLTHEQFTELEKTESQVQYGLALSRLGILDQWKKEAEEGIQLLENLTGKKFLNDSKRGNFDPPTQDQITEEDEKIRSGYYTEEAKKVRDDAKIQAKIQKLETDTQKQISDLLAELDLKKQVLKTGGQKALSNFIFYKHSREISFSWKTYGDKLTASEISEILSKITLPEGITVRL